MRSRLRSWQSGLLFHEGVQLVASARLGLLLLQAMQLGLLDVELRRRRLQLRLVGLQLRTHRMELRLVGLKLRRRHLELRLIGLEL